jgi:hypothetical protein
MGCMVNCQFISKVRVLGISAVCGFDVCDKMMLRKNYECKNKFNTKQVHRT